MACPRQFSLRRLPSLRTLCEHLMREARPYGKQGLGFIIRHKRALKTGALTIIAIGFVAALASSIAVW